MARFVAKAPNDNYQGKTLGVRFEDGVAVVDDATVPKALGRDATQIATELTRDFGYEVTNESDGTRFVVPDLSEIKGTKAHAEKTKGKKATPPPTPPQK